MMRWLGLRNVGAALAVMLASAMALGNSEAATRTSEAPLVPRPLPPVTATAFVGAVVASNNYEESAGAYALKRASSAEVKDFARAMIVDHREATRRLKWLLTKHDQLVVLPTHVSTDYLFVIDQLVFASAADFDHVYIAQQMQAHKEALMLAEEYARKGDDLDLRRFAERS